MLRKESDVEVLDYPKRARVDHVDGVALRVWDVHEGTRVSRGSGQVIGAIGRVDVDGSARADIRRGRRGGSCARGELGQVRDGAVLAAAAGDEHPAAERDGGEVAERCGQHASETDAAARQIDGDDPTGRRAQSRPAAADHEHRPPDCSSSGMRDRRGQGRGPVHPVGSRIEHEHRLACGACGQRSTCDHHPSRDGGCGRIANRVSAGGQQRGPVGRVARRRPCRASDYRYSRRRRRPYHRRPRQPGRSSAPGGDRRPSLARSRRSGGSGRAGSFRCRRRTGRRRCRARPQRRREVRLAAVRAGARRWGRRY